MGISGVGNYHANPGRIHSSPCESAPFRLVYCLLRLIGANPGCISTHLRVFSTPFRAIVYRPERCGKHSEMSGNAARICLNQTE